MNSLEKGSVLQRWSPPQPPDSQGQRAWASWAHCWPGDKRKSFLRPISAGQKQGLRTQRRAGCLSRQGTEFGWPGRRWEVDSVPPANLSPAHQQPAVLPTVDPALSPPVLKMNLINTQNAFRPSVHKGVGLAAANSINIVLKKPAHPESQPHRCQRSKNGHHP